ncbi:MAG: VTC domain-containing protein, partial [Thermoleophilia bacterium]|nr:VTC domain-containing protein [Thermoleophilia bacterium]
MTAIDTTHAHAAGPAGVQPLRAENRPSALPNLHLSVACPASGLAPLRERVEQKYFVPPGRQMAAFALLRRTCRAEAVYPVGQVNSLYFDTPDLDQHERSLSGEHAKDKVRIRWYGEEHDPHRTRATGGVDAAAARRLSGPAGGCQDTVEVWLELKSRRGFASTKQRLALPVLAPALAFPVLGRGVVSSTTLTRTMAGFGFIPGGPLRPVVAISYWRYRFVEPETGFRISIDSHIRSSLIMPGLGRGEREVELPGAVVEVKGPFFHLPRALRPVADIGTSWTRYSKYSSSLEAHE